MKLILQEVQKSIFGAILFISITFSGIPTAHALAIGDQSLPILCGPVHTPPFSIYLGNTYRTITTSTTVSVLNKGTADRKILRHFIVIKMLKPNGTQVWTRSLITQSLAIAEVDLTTTPPSYSLPDVLDASGSGRTAIPAFMFPTECLNAMTAESGNTTYLAVALGTTSSAGGGNVKGKDKTVINISILNLNNGKVLRTFKVRPKLNMFFQLASSGIFDIDNDGDDELVLTYIKFIGLTRYDFIAQLFDIRTGALKKTITTTQNNTVKFQK